MSFSGIIAYQQKGSFALRLHDVFFASLIPLFSIALTGCATHSPQQNLMLDQCVKDEIRDAKYVTKRTSVDHILSASTTSCGFDLGIPGVLTLADLTPTQKAVYSGLAWEKIKSAPLYQFTTERDDYKGIVSISGDYIKNNGASDNYYTEASLNFIRLESGNESYFITVVRSGLARGDFETAFFKDGAILKAKSIEANVRCPSSIFCFWTEMATVDIPSERIKLGKELDFKLSGKTDSDPMIIPKEYISMFLSEVNKIK